MPKPFGSRLLGALHKATSQLRRPENLAFLPAVTLASFWLGGERTLLMTALGLPGLFLLAGAFRFVPNGPIAFGAGLSRSDLTARLDMALRVAEDSNLATACLVLRLDDLADLIEDHGHAAHAEVLQRSQDRLTSALREGDGIARLEGDSFAVALRPVRQMNLDAVLQLGARLQAALANPISIDAARVYVTASVGFCLGARAPAPSGAALLEAAEIAADDAGRNGPGAIRGFSTDLQQSRTDRCQMRVEIERALDDGQIVAHFQPQIRAKSGEIAGFEALARWQHPSRGLIPPAEFLPVIEQAGLSERLGETMLFQTLTALSAWDAAGHRVPCVGVNFSADQLRNPRLADALKWELDRFDLTPERLSVEILETVVADTDNDVIVHTIAALSQLGCGIDLDDFGTGHAAIANIRRFAVRRIKIDRSFVTHADTDPGQQQMVAAILSLAERLDIETVAEGVERPGEQTTLAELGCHVLQGFGIARPMPYEDTLPWLEAHEARVPAPSRLGRHAV